MPSLLVVLLRHKRAVILLTLAGFAISSAVSMLLPPRYVASAVFTPAGIAQDISSQRGFLAPLGRFGESFSSILRAQKSFMIDSFLRSGRLTAILVNRFDLKRVYGVESSEEAGKRLRLNTRVVVRDEGAISLSVEDRDPARAAAMATAYIAILDSLLIDISVDNARESIDYLNVEISRVEKEIAHSDSLLGAYLNEHGVYDMQQQLSAMLSVVTDLTARLSVLDVEKQLLKTMMTPSSSELGRVEFEWNELRRQLFMLREQGAEPNLFPSFKRLPEITSAVAGLTSKRRVQEFVVNYLRIRLADSERTASNRITVLRVIDPPVPPEQRAWPKRKQIVMISTAASFFWAVFILLVREKWRDGTLSLDMERTMPSARDAESG